MNVLVAVALAAGEFFTLRSVFGWQANGFAESGVPAGLLRLWNETAERLGRLSYVLVQKVSGAGVSAGLALVVIFLFLFLLSYLTVQSKSPGLLVLYYILPVLGAALGLPLEAGPFALLIGASLLFLARLRLGDGARFWALGGVCVLLLLTWFIVTQKPLADVLSARPAPLTDISAHGKEAVHRLRYGHEAAEDETAFTVTMEEPGQLWLRGKIGETYDGTAWTALPDAAQYAYYPRREALREAGFNALGQLADVTRALEGVDGSADAGHPVKEGKITIEMKGENRENLLIPYEITASHVKGGVNAGDSFLQARGFFGARRYSYTALTDRSAHWTEMAAHAFSAASAGTLPGAYADGEEAVNESAYARYTALNRGDILLLNDAIGDPGDQNEGHISYRYAVDHILPYLEDNIRYEEKRGREQTPLAQILEAGKGSDRDFAALATAMFRYYGIPARYVEGYQVTAADAQKMHKNEPYAVKGKNAHAWTEIYIDLLGWVPLETVPAYKDRMEQADLSIGLENEEIANAFHEHKPIMQEGTEENSLPEGNSRKTKPIWIMLLVIALLLLLLILMRVICTLIKIIERHRRFHQSDPKRAICYIYAELTGAIPAEKTLDPAVVKLGERAAYSTEAMSEEERSRMLTAWKGRKAYAR